MIKCKYDGIDKEFKPEEIIAILIEKLKEYADTHLNQRTSQCVITVPAYFDIKQRQAIMDAAKLAKLNATQLINKPIAVALAYGIDKDKNAANNKTLVIHLGGRTLEVTFLCMNAGNLVV